MRYTREGPDWYHHYLNGLNAMHLIVAPLFSCVFVNRWLPLPFVFSSRRQENESDTEGEALAHKLLKVCLRWAFCYILNTLHFLQCTFKLCLGFSFIYNFFLFHFILCEALWICQVLMLPWIAIPVDASFVFKLEPISYTTLFICAFGCTPKLDNISMFI